MVGWQLRIVNTTRGLNRVCVLFARHLTDGNTTPSVLNTIQILCIPRTMNHIFMKKPDVSVRIVPLSVSVSKLELMRSGVCGVGLNRQPERNLRNRENFPAIKSNGGNICGCSLIHPKKALFRALKTPKNILYISGVSA